MRLPRSALRYDDLEAARLICSSRPGLRQALADGLRVLDTTPEGRDAPNLLKSLLDAGLINREQAVFVHRRVARGKRGRALGLYMCLLRDEGGVPAERVQGLVRRLGDEGHFLQLRDAVVAAGSLDAESAARLCFRAKVALDRDATRQVHEYRLRAAREREQAGESTATAFAKALGRPPEQPPGASEETILPAAEATCILDRAALTTARLQRLNLRFPIPDRVDTSDPRVGDAVGDYRILGRVGAGNMGTVYLAEHDDHLVPIALKLLAREASSEQRGRFKREILANGFFSHDNVVDVYDAGVTRRGQHFLAMEYVDGDDLEQLLKARGFLPVAQSLAIARQMLEALDSAHGAGIVHRDIKPANILLASASGVAKLMDFGVARIQNLGQFKSKVFETEQGGITGTPQYLSPEQAAGDPVGPASDLYSLGTVLYELVSGRLPFAAESLRGWINCRLLGDPLPIAEAMPMRPCPPGLDELFTRLFVRQPEERVQTAREVIPWVDAVVAGLDSRFAAENAGGWLG